MGAPRIVILSGAICSGKTELCKGFQDRFDAKVVKTRELIRTINPRVRDERGALQRAGKRLDKRDGGVWVQKALTKILGKLEARGNAPSVVVVDSAMIQGQVDAIRSGFGLSVFHIHLNADKEERRRRFEERAYARDSGLTFEQAISDSTERRVEGLQETADIVVNSGRCTTGCVLVRATALLGLYPRSNSRLVDVVVGGQYGSEGKGNIVGHIAPEYQWLVRVGGPNAGHQVFADPPEKYHHLPSGTGRALRAGLVLGPGAIIHVPTLLDEIQRSSNVTAARLRIDPQAMIIEESDKIAEKALRARIGSTASGVGAATARKINDRGLKGKNKVRLAGDVAELRPYLRETQEILEEAYQREEKILLEGTQGTALSLHHGEYPYVTSRDTTVAGCLAEAGIAPARVRRAVMVCRTIPIRVAGNSGPIGLEIEYEVLSKRSKVDLDKLRATERTTTTNQQRRLGEFDWRQLHRSALLNGPTDIALTFVDYIDVENKKAFRYEQLTEETLRFIEEVERVTGVQVSLISTDFDWRNVIDRRSW